MPAKKPSTQQVSSIQRLIGSLLVLGTLFGVQVGAESMVEGQVRLASGEPVAGAHVRLFDLRDLRSWHLNAQIHPATLSVSCAKIL